MWRHCGTRCSENQDGTLPTMKSITEQCNYIPHCLTSHYIASHCLTSHYIASQCCSPAPPPAPGLRWSAPAVSARWPLSTLVHWNFCNSRDCGRSSTLHLVARHCTTGAVSLLHCIVLSIGRWQRDGGLVANIGRLAAPTHGQDALLDRCKPLLDEKSFSGIVSSVKASFNGLSEVNHDLQ